MRLRNYEIDVDYLNNHAEDFAPPLGLRHLHLSIMKRVYWAVVTRRTKVCGIKGRCFIVQVRAVQSFPSLPYRPAAPQPEGTSE
jgi:hypothetical protein